MTTIYRIKWKRNSNIKTGTRRQVEATKLLKILYRVFHICNKILFEHEKYLYYSWLSCNSNTFLAM